MQTLSTSTSASRNVQCLRCIFVKSVYPNFFKAPSRVQPSHLFCFASLKEAITLLTDSFTYNWPVWVYWLFDLLGHILSISHLIITIIPNKCQAFPPLNMINGEPQLRIRQQSYFSHAQRRGRAQFHRETYHLSLRPARRSNLASAAHYQPAVVHLTQICAEESYAEKTKHKKHIFRLGCIFLKTLISEGLSNWPAIKTKRVF